jgi:hypothetical protein
MNGLATPAEIEQCAALCLERFGFVFDGMVAQEVGKTIRYADVSDAIKRVRAERDLKREVVKLVQPMGQRVLSASLDADNNASAWSNLDVVIFTSAPPNLEWFIGRSCVSAGPGSIHMSNRWD